MHITQHFSLLVLLSFSKNLLKIFTVPFESFRILSYMWTVVYKYNTDVLFIFDGSSRVLVQSVSRDDHVSDAAY